MLIDKSAKGNPAIRAFLQSSSTQLLEICGPGLPDSVRHMAMELLLSLAEGKPMLVIHQLVVLSQN